VGYDELGLASCCGFGGPRGGAMEATAVDISSVVEQASDVCSGCGEEGSDSLRSEGAQEWKIALVRILCRFT